ncbi:FeoB-associated Cys-rich membrane protein [Paenibacillus eucommiae]|uniref:DUF2911 domain-containing protein n=1 Tax=Paenibacillus eucommiae TaxID=1355755 RepID=A0ABS4IRI4_9BACL|nr:FeoB-associated Cys-rich membrane protein [Paenibacillus eucommiae]MBP1989626.1 hypothetical protein [Paenibacillus eucommiae]
MKILIGVMLVIILVFVIYFMIQKKSKNKIMASASNLDNFKPVKFNTEPDFPVGFGYKCQWLAIKTMDTQGVKNQFKLRNAESSNWESGIAGAYKGYYFITPPVDGWTLIINSTMPDLSVQKEPLKIITELSTIFGEAYYFGTHRIVEYHGWAKAIEGKVERAYGYVGESGETIVNIGEISHEEIENKLIFTELNVEEPVLPNEEDVLMIAKKWTIDPLMNERNYSTGTGYIGTLK